MKIPEKLLVYKNAFVALQAPCTQKDMRMGGILKSVIDSGKQELDSVLYSNTIVWLEQMLDQGKSDYIVSILKVA